MHDPSTVAFEIKSPIRRRSDFFPKGYRKSLITIWHEDPMNFEGKCAGRSDDSCGWHTPLMRLDERDTWRKRSDYEYTCVFNKQHVTAKGESYARVCYHPETTYDAVYWTWRSIRHDHLKDKWWYRTVWRYSSRLSASELEAIQNLATNPVDNVQFTVQNEITDAESFWPFYRCVLNAYRRHARPWYRHPRWHFWHWQFQVHPWQTFRRWAFSRCAGCGKRFPWGYSPVSHQWDSPKPKLFRGEVGVFHSECSHARVTLEREPAAGSA
jgi:hypothetical protein